MTVSSQSPSGIDFDSVSILIETTERDFVRANLERYQPPDFPALSGATIIINRLKNSRLLMITGDPGMDPLSFARYSAWCLREELSLNTSSPLDVMEWNGLGGQAVDQAVERFKTPTIFILPHLKPQHVNFQIVRLLRALGEQHYAIIAIEQTRPWLHLLGEVSLRQYSENLGDGRIFSRADLVRFLADRLRSHLPEALRQHSRNRRVFVVSTPIEQVADRLENFVNIDKFVRLLKEAAAQRGLDDEAVKSSLELATDETALLRELYSRLQTPRGQLLALALSLLNGLTESQFFAVVDLLVTRAWRVRDPTLCALDYCDLDLVEHFFETSPSNIDGERVFKAHLKEQRRRLLEVVWSQHRRNVLSALPVLFQCVQDSLDAQADNLVLYGGPTQRAQLRKTLGETLGDISALDTITTESYLIRLAIHPNVGAQAVAANALAHWRNCDKLPRLVALLRRWMDDEEIRRTVERLNHDSSNADLPTALSSVKQTVAMTVGYAAQNDRSNLIHPELLNILEQLSQEQDLNVLKVLASSTIPMLLTRHFRSLERIIRRLTRQEALHEALAQSIAQTYRKQPVDVKEVLDEWLKASMRGVAAGSGSTRATNRALALMCICTIFGRLPYKEVPQGFSIAEMIERMRRVLQEERDAGVRRAALTAIIAHSRTHFRTFQDLVAELNADEQAKIVAKLIEVYQEQRRQQVGGEDTIRINGHYYPIWITQARPLTSIEVEMVDWVKDSRHPIAQQIAVQAQIGFLRELDREVERRIRQIEAARSRRRRPQPSAHTSRPSPLLNGLYPRVFYEYYIIPWLVTMFAPQYRAIIRGILPELIEQGKAKVDLSKLLLLKWVTITDDVMVEIGNRARWALFWASPQGKYLFAGICICLFLAVLAILILLFQLIS